MVVARNNSPLGTRRWPLVSLSSFDRAFGAKKFGVGWKPLFLDDLEGKIAVFLADDGDEKCSLGTCTRWIWQWIGKGRPCHCDLF